MSLSSNPAQKSGAFGSGSGILAGRLFGPQFGIVAIGVDAGASALLRSLGTQSRLAAGEISKTQQVLTIFGKTLGASVGALSLTAGAVAGAGFAVQGFQQVIADTAAILDKDVAEVFERTGKLSIQLSKSFAFSASEIQGAVKQLGQAGQSLEQIEDTLKPVLTFVAATGADMGDAVDLVVKTLNGFKLEATDTQRVLDSLMFVINTSPTTVNDLQNAFKQLVPVTAQLGISLESTAAAVAAVSRAGLAGSTGGTSLASGLIQLLSPAKAVEEQYGNLISAFRETLEVTGDLAIAFDAFLGEAGTNIVEFEKSIDQIRDSEGIKSFEELSEGTLAQLGTRFEVINILLDIFGTRSAKGFLDFSANAKQALADTVALQLGLADTASNAEKTIQTIQSQVQILRNQFLAPLLEGDFASSLTEKLEKLADSGVFERLGGVFADFSGEGLEAVIQVLDGALNALEAATPSLVAFTVALNSIVDIFNVFADVAGSKFGSALLTSILGFKILKAVFGGIITEMGVLVHEYANLGEKQFRVAGSQKALSLQQVENITHLHREIELREMNLALRKLEATANLQELVQQKAIIESKMVAARASLARISTHATDSPSVLARRTQLAAEIRTLSLEYDINTVAIRNNSIALQKEEMAIDKLRIKKAELAGTTVQLNAADKSSDVARRARIAGIELETVTTGSLIKKKFGLVAVSIASTAAFLGVFKAMALLREGHTALGIGLISLIAAYAAFNLIMSTAKIRQVAYATATTGAALSTILLNTAINPLFIIGFTVALTAGIAALAIWRANVKDTAKEMDAAATSFDVFSNKLSFFKLENDFSENINQSISFSFRETIKSNDLRTDVFDLQIKLVAPTQDDVDNVVLAVKKMNSTLADDDDINIDLFTEESLSTFEGRIKAAREIIESDIIPDEDKIMLATGLVGKSAADAFVNAYRENLKLTGITVKEIENAENERILSQLQTLAEKSVKEKAGSLNLFRDTFDLFTVSVSDVFGDITNAFRDGALSQQELSGIQTRINKLSASEVETLRKALNENGIVLDELLQLSLDSQQLQIDTTIIRETLDGIGNNLEAKIARFNEDIGSLGDIVNKLSFTFTEVVLLNGEYLSVYDSLNRAGADASESMKALTAINESLTLISTLEGLEAVFKQASIEIPPFFNAFRTVIQGELLGQTVRLGEAWGIGATLQSTINNQMQDSALKVLEAQRFSALLTIKHSRQRAVFENARLNIDRQILEQYARFGLKNQKIDGRSLAEVNEAIAANIQTINDADAKLKEVNEAYDAQIVSINSLTNIIQTQAFKFDARDAGSSLATVLESLQEATTDIVNGVRIPNESFKKMSDAGLNVAAALDILRELTIKTQILSIFTNIAKAFESINVALPEAFRTAMTQFAVGIAGLGTEFAKVFDPALFDSTTIGQMWAAAMDSPRFEQNNNIVIRISGDSSLDPAKAAEFADAVITEMNNRQRLQNAG